MVLNCDRVFELLSDYLDDELGPELRAAFEAHVQGCDRCSRFGQDFAEVVEGLRSATRPPMSPALRERLEDLLGGDPPNG